MSEAPPAPGPRQRLLVAIAAALLVGQMAIAMLLSAAGDAPTFDEPEHLAAGIAYTHYRDLEPNVEHPPLAKAIAALPLRLTDVPVPSDGALGGPALFAPGADPRRVFWLARLPMIALSLVLALVVFGFGRDLFGAGAALVGLAIVSVCPTVLGHGRLVHTDVAVSAFVATTLWFLWRARYLGDRWLLAPGASFGLALSSKFTALVFIPVVVALTALSRRSATKGVGQSHGAPGRARRPGARLVGAAVRSSVVLVLAFASLWAVYLAIDPRLRFDRVVATAGMASGPAAAIADLMPVPQPYREGLRFAIHADQLGRHSFLFGERYLGGRPEYYPMVLLMKSPLASVAL